MNYIQCDFLSLIRLGLGKTRYSSIKQTLNKSFILKKIRTNNVLVSFILNHIIFDKRSDRNYILIYFISGKFPHLTGKIERKTSNVHSIIQFISGIFPHLTDTVKLIGKAFRCTQYTIHLHPFIIIAYKLKTAILKLCSVVSGRKQEAIDVKILLAVTLPQQVGWGGGVREGSPHHKG
jgi:hypothetical protein